MITWIKNLVFGKDYAKPDVVNPQITDAVTQKAPKKTTTKKKTTSTKKPEVAPKTDKKTTTRKKK